MLNQKLQRSTAVPPLHRLRAAGVMAAAVMALSACAMFGLGKHQDDPQRLLGSSRQVPPNQSTATATSAITVAANRNMAGAVVTKGIKATEVHVHSGAPGINGAVLVTLEQTGANTFSVPHGATLSQAQAMAYAAGNLYVDVHSDAYPEGEIRAQLLPSTP
ncbi:MAG: CHRD domain-containing protein [Janthinobacterium lividum]